MEGYLRVAAKADMDLLFTWANEALVRKNSFSTRTISYEEHKKWFWELMESQNCRQYIYMFDKKETGQVRLVTNGGTAEINYSICAQKRGQGHGKKILRLVCSQVKQDFPEVKKLIGRVKPENIASRRAFLSVGFEEKNYVYELTVCE